ncbi:MAG: nucleoside triphosphate pyrophosphohydrolase [Thermoanaerobaculia bacterium]
MTDRLKKLEDLVERLRGPDGCPWDREQELPDLRAYLLEEAHELAAAIDQGNRDEIRDELGDLLFHVVFVSKLLQSSNAFELDLVIDRIHQKMIDRHPHVFGEDSLSDSEQVHRAWEERKAEHGRSALAGVPSTLPALLATYRVSQKAAGVGFDWPDAASVLNKVKEELAEVDTALAQDLGVETIEQEVGDLLFATANLARKLGFDPEAALQRANLKFRRRFDAVESLLKEDERLSEKSLDELEELWRRVKESEGPK